MINKYLSSMFSFSHFDIRNRICGSQLSILFSGIRFYSYGTNTIQLDLKKIKSLNMSYAIVYVIFLFNRYLYCLFFDRTVMSTEFSQRLSLVESIAEAMVSLSRRSTMLLQNTIL